MGQSVFDLTRAYAITKVPDPEHKARNAFVEIGMNAMMQWFIQSIDPFRPIQLIQIRHTTVILKLATTGSPRNLKKLTGL
mgnify:CR=1 FL=1